MLDFEQAALCRDQIADLRQVQQRQHVEGERRSRCGGLRGAVRRGLRAGFRVSWRPLCSATRRFPRLPEEEEAGAVLSAFLAQYYLDKTVPTDLLVSHEPTEIALLIQAFQERVGHRVQIAHRPRGERPAGWPWHSKTPSMHWSPTCLVRLGCIADLRRYGKHWAANSNWRDWNVSTSATLTARRPLRRVWCSARKGRSSLTIVATISKGYSGR